MKTLVRMITLQELERMEEQFQGKTPTMFVPVSDTTMAKTPDINFDKQYAQEHPEELPTLKQNVIELKKSHAYFMVGSSNEEAMNSIIICAHQPQSEDAAEGKNITKKSYFARGAVALCVYEVPDEVYDLWEKRALIKTNDKNENYVNLDGTQTELDEVIVGNIVFPELFKYLKAFGPYAEVCDSLGFTPKEYDPTGVLSESTIDSEYFTVHPHNMQNTGIATEHTESFTDWVTAKHQPQSQTGKTQIDTPYTDPELSKMYIAITSAKISKSEKADLLAYLEMANTNDIETRELVLSSIAESLDGNANIM